MTATLTAPASPTQPGSEAAGPQAAPPHAHHAWDAPERLVIADVPEIGFHLHGCPFPACLATCLRFLGHGPRLGHRARYDYLMAVTGAAFRRFWERDDCGNADLMNLAPEPYRRAFHALGMAYRVVPHWDHAAMIAAVKETVAHGAPALGFGIVGPPECGLVTGYDRDGDVLIGRSYFQPPAERGYFAKAAWHETLTHSWYGGLILLGELHEAPPEIDVLRSTLTWAIDLSRTPRRTSRPNHLSGLIAYEGWADGLEHDRDYPEDDPGVLQTRIMVHAGQVSMLRDRRSAATYLRTMIDVAPEPAGEQLFAAAAQYDLVAAEAPHVWPWGHAPAPDGAESDPAVGLELSRAAVRHDIAHHVMLAAAHEVRAVENLELALGAIGRG